MPIVFYAIKILSVIVGFFGAFSLMRWLSTAFNWYAGIVFGGRVNYGFFPSLLILLAAMAALAFSAWKIKRRENSLLSRIDFSLILLIGGVGFYACYLLIMRQIVTRRMPWEVWPMGRDYFWESSLNDIHAVVLYMPLVAYLLAAFCFAELIVRVRDGNFSLYWLAFFKAYRSRAISYIAAALIVSQLFLIFYSRSLPVMLVSLAAICLLTYFATFLLSLSKIYHAANEDKIRAERFKAELITNVSHDIKTPLTSIISYVDLLKNEHLQGQAARHLQVLDRKTTRLKTLIDDLMEASKAGTGNLRVDLQEVNLSEIVGQVAGEFEDIFNDNGLTLVLRQPDTPILFHTDSRHLHRVLENLFSNAAKYALGGTRVFTEITLHNARPQIIMQNTSASPVDFSDGEATEQFIRGDKSRQTEGSGLGLYIAKSLVELMGGKLGINVSGDLFRVEVLL
jgi:signal transduction histidine kinase